MDDHKLDDPYEHIIKDHKSTVNKEYLNQKFLKKKYISSSTAKKGVFRYIMEEVDESRSENNIIVDGIKEFPASPHDVNKKANSFRMGKGAQNWYSSRLSFNMYKLPEGEYTLVIKLFPPSMNQVTLFVVSTSLNIGQQSTKLFPNPTTADLSFTCISGM